MFEQPIYLRIPTENEQPYFARHSCAEVVIGAVIKAQQSSWLRLHGFVVLPEALEMVATPIKFSLSTLVGHLEFGDHSAAEHPDPAGQPDLEFLFSPYAD